MTDLVLLFRLDVEHTYFKSMKNLNLGFSPAGITVMLISKYFLYFLERSNGFELYIDMNRLAMLSEYLREEKTGCLEFIMTMNDRNFLNYTELDLPKGSFLLLRSPGPAEPDSDIIRLHHDDFVSGKDFTETSSAVAASVPTAFCLKPNSFALLQLPVNKSGDDIALVDGNGKLISCAFTIKFKARSTFWKYVFVAREDSSFDSMQVIDSAGQITFSKMVSGDGSEGSPTYLTESDERIPLREISDAHFQLKGIQNGTDHIIIQRLAEPNPDYLSKVNGKLYSTIFIYY